MVVNGFVRRGAKVVATSGQSKCHHHNMKWREGWVAADPMPFFTEVEAWD
jgi:hypothetical protein